MVVKRRGMTKKAKRRGMTKKAKMRQKEMRVREEVSEVE